MTPVAFIQVFLYSSLTTSSFVNYASFEGVNSTHKKKTELEELHLHSLHVSFGPLPRPPLFPIFFIFTFLVSFNLFYL